MKTEQVAHEFAPVFDEKSKVLILGTFPSTSLANAAYSLDRLMKYWGEIKEYLLE